MSTYGVLLNNLVVWASLLDFRIKTTKLHELIARSGFDRRY